MKYMTNENNIVTALTLLSTFLMGFIDVYTFLNYDGLFASAQTGNMVILGAKLLKGDFWEVLIHAFSFIGFMIGAFAAQGIVERYKNRSWKRYRKYLFFQLVFLLILALIQTAVSASLIAFLLGLLAGYELTVFRKVKNTGMNNGIMTGNTKNLMNNMYLAVFHKKKEALQTFLDLLLGISLFLFGVIAGAAVLLISPLLILWLAFSLTAVFYFLLLFRKSDISH